MPTLYRKYRPQKFSEIIGQEHLTQTLTGEISTGRLAQAYLFSGPRGIGKTTMARILAKAVNCQNRQEGEFEPCNQCSSCQEIAACHNIDVVEIDAASNTGVDNVRENIIDSAQFKPTKSKYKVFIIDEVHMLSTSAFNALLKTLEEPPSHIIFVLATTELHKLPATIVSRCQRFNFKKIPEDLMVKKLNEMAEAEKVKIEKDVLKRIATKSDGCMRDAESLLGQLISLDLKKISSSDAELILPTVKIEAVLEYLSALAEKKSSDALQIIDRLVEEGANLDQFALEIIDVARAVMLAQAGQQNIGSDYSEKDRKKILELARKFNQEKIITLIDSTIKRRMEIKTAPVPQLPLELLAVEFADENTKEVDNDNDDNQPAPPAVKNQEKKPEVKKEETEEAVEAKEVKTVIEEPSKETESVGAPDLDLVNAKWPEVINKMSENHPSLVFILKMASIDGLDQDRVMISVPYSFHKEKIENLECKKTIEDCLSELMGKRTQITCLVKEEEKKKTNDAEIGALAAQFGGEVV